MKRASRRVALTFGIGVAVFGTVLIALHCDGVRPPPIDATAEQDAVYEAVVRYVSDHHGVAFKRLVFEERTTNGAGSGAPLSVCIDRTRSSLEHFSAPRPAYDSLADRLYRVATFQSIDDSIDSGAIRDFVEKLCSTGELSRTFRTDAQKVFIDGASVTIGSMEIPTPSQARFEDRYPGAPGLMSFSQVGFDSRFRDAIVRWSIICGLMCGGGNDFVLKKTSGRWSVVGALDHWDY